MTAKKIDKIDVTPKIVNYGEEEEKALYAIFNEDFIEYLCKIDLSEINEQKHEKIILEMGDVITKNLIRPNKSINPDQCIYFYSKGLLAVAIATKTFLDFKKFKSEYEKR